jgi:hypothetical protein
LAAIHLKRGKKLPFNGIAPVEGVRELFERIEAVLL